MSEKADAIHDFFQFLQDETALLIDKLNELPSVDIPENWNGFDLLAEVWGKFGRLKDAAYAMAEADTMGEDETASLRIAIDLIADQVADIGIKSLTTLGVSLLVGASGGIAVVVPATIIAALVSTGAHWLIDDMEATHFQFLPSHFDLMFFQEDKTLFGSWNWVTDSITYAGSTNGIVLDLIGAESFVSRYAGVGENEQVYHDRLVYIDIYETTNFANTITIDREFAGQAYPEVYGLDGNDIFAIGKGENGAQPSGKLDGGDAWDTLFFYDPDATNAYVNLETGIAKYGQNGAVGAHYTIANIEEVHGTIGMDEMIGSSGIDHLYGEDGKDVLSGGAGNDSLDGGDGNDRITGGAGSNTLVGGADYDTLIYTTVDETFQQGGQDIGIHAIGNQVHHASGGTVFVDTISEFEKIEGTGFSDLIVAVDAADIFAGGGHDTIYGGAGADMVYGGAGNDRFYASDGVDKFEGESGYDWYDFSTAAEGVRIDLRDASSKLITNDGFGNVEGLWAGYSIEAIQGSQHDDNFNLLRGNVFEVDMGAGNDTVYGSLEDDVIRGGGNNDYLVGHNGNDDIYGGSGSDTLKGWAGTDYLWGGSGDDFFDFFDDTLDVIMDFEGAGVDGGDYLLIQGFSSVTFGYGSTVGGINFRDVEGSNMTLVCFNEDTDGYYERKIYIDDGDVLASAYTLDDVFCIA